MSDQSDVPAIEPEEAAQDAVEQQESQNPWGDDFDAQRAWNKQQALSRELQEIKERNRMLREDPEHFLEFASQHHRDLLAEEEAERANDSEEPEFEEDDLVAPLRTELDEIKQWKQNQEARETAAQIRKDLQEFNAETGWELDDDDHQAIVYRANQQNPKGFGPDELKQAHKWFIDRLERAASQGVEKAKAPKPKAPHVTAAGKPGTQVPDLDNESERHAWLREQMAQRGT